MADASVVSPPTGAAPVKVGSSAARDAILELKVRIGKSVLGQDHLIERLLIGLLGNGHLLIESLPGLAKTRAVKTLAKNLAADLSRVQFTPDLLPSDVTGAEIYVQTDKGGQFQFQKGPIFANLVLADEINRAPAKVQSALLEAMEERQVTVAGKTYKLPELFMVLATREPDRAGRHLSAAGGAARPLPDARRHHLSRRGRRGRDHQAQPRGESRRASKEQAAEPAAGAAAGNLRRARARSTVFSCRMLRSATWSTSSSRRAFRRATRSRSANGSRSAQVRAAALRSTAARGCARGSTANRS